MNNNDDYNSEDSGDEGGNNYKDSTHENPYKLMKVKTRKVANTSIVLFIFQLTLLH